jgi:vacuolar-type H+-ATPase subunit E/Vma4
MDANERENAADVARTVSNAGNAAAGTAARMKRDISDKAEDAKQSIRELGRNAAEKLDKSRSSAADALEWTASSLHTRADQVSDFTHSAADRLQNTADYVRETDFQLFKEDVQELVKRYPGRSLIVAAVLGFVVARGLRNIRG